jgi:hypothetical protein
LDELTTIKELEHEKFYKYLGVDECDSIQHSIMKEKLRKEYFRRIRLILTSELNSANKFSAINGLCVPVIQYSFGIIDWNQAELKKLDTKSRKLLTMHSMHHPRADVDRIYMSRSDGGRGLINLESSHKVAIVGLNRYLELNADMYLRTAFQHEKSKAKMKSIPKVAEKIIADTNLEELNAVTGIPTIEAKRLKELLRCAIADKRKQRFEEKPLHGQFFVNLRKENIDSKQSLAWLRSSGLKGETESLIIAAQDQSLPTRYYQKNILHQHVNSKCRLCKTFEETTHHILAGCPVLANTEYLHRHNQMAAIVHWHICKHYGIPVTDKVYEHKPEQVQSSADATVLWDMTIHTDRTITANRPDIVVKDNAKRTCYILDISVPMDCNVVKKSVEKISKYKNLEIEIRRMWNMKTSVIPVIVGALGTISCGTEDYINSIPGNSNLFELQKSALLGSAHILRKVLDMNI